jgi:hypothetical protein
MVLVAGGLRGDEAAEGGVADSAGTLAHDRVVDVAGDDEQERAMRRFERLLDAGASSRRKAMSSASP